MEWLGVAGLIARGAIYLLIGAVALQIAFGHRAKEANQTGAMQELASHTGGFMLLLVLVVGLVAYALWCFAQAALGVVDKGKKATARITRFAAGCVYSSFSFTGIQILLDSGNKSQADKQSGWTADVMEHTGGRWAVAIAGLAVIAGGGYFVYKGVTTKFDKHLKLGEMDEKTRKTVVTLGVIGTTARGLVFGLSGLLILIAAIDYDPKKARGLDGALRQLASAPLGRLLLAVAAAGLFIFGIYGLCEAKWRRTS
jgi:hypothetical protein